MLSKILSITVLIALLILGVVYFDNISALFDKGEATLLEQKSEKALGNRDFTSVIASYEQQHQKKPKNIEVSLKLAELYQQQLNGDKAEALYRGVLAEDAEHEEALTIYGDYLAQMPSRRNEAVGLYRNAMKGKVASGRVSPEILLKLGDLYKMAGQNPEETRGKVKNWLNRWAIYYYRNATERDPMLFQGYFNLGVLYQHMSMPGRAAIQYCNALLIAPKSYESHYNIGLVLIDFRAYDEGFRELSSAVQLLSEQGKVSQARHLAERVQSIKNTYYYERSDALSVPGELSVCL